MSSVIDFKNFTLRKPIWSISKSRSNNKHGFYKTMVEPGNEFLAVRYNVFHYVTPYVKSDQLLIVLYYFGTRQPDG